MKKLFMKLPDPIKGPILRKRVCIDESKLDGTTFKIANTVEELESAYRLVHDVYVKEGYMDPHPSKMRITKYNLLPKSTTFVGKHDGRVVLTMSLIPDSEHGLPMDSLFKNELDQMRSRGRYIAEVGNLASDPNFRNRNQNVPMHANKIMHSYAYRYLNIHDLVIAINPRHKWFYRNILIFKKISGKRDYDYVKGAPAVAMTLDLLKLNETYQRAYGHPNGTPPPEISIISFSWERVLQSISPGKRKPIFL